MHIVSSDKVCFSCFSTNTYIEVSLNRKRPFDMLMNNRPTPAVNFTWLGTSVFQLQLELYSSALGEVGQIPFFVYFCLLIDPTFMNV